MTAQTVEIGALDVLVPGDWFDVLADDTVLAARARFDAVVGATVPRAGGPQRGALVQALMDWRQLLLDGGAVLHGLIHAPIPGGTGHATWHILAGAVALPEAGEVDLSAVVARALGAQLDPQASVVEAFDTDLGLGVGLITQPVIEPPSDVPDELARLGVVGHEPVRVGLAAGLAFPPDGGFGFLVAGMCVDPEQVLELAAVVAVIAGRARLQEASVDGPTAEDGQS